MTATRPCLECGAVGPHLRGCGQVGEHRTAGPTIVGTYFDGEGRQRLRLAP